MHKLDENDPNVMLIGSSRMFYNGLLGNSCRVRQLGSYTIYVAQSGPFCLSVEDGPWQRLAIAAVPPYARHRISAMTDTITTICIEPETVSENQLAALSAMMDRRATTDALIRRVQQAKRHIASAQDCTHFTTQDFDSLFLNMVLEERQIDERIDRTLHQFRTKADDHNLSAETCARSSDLSTSRFLHLFRDQTGQRFRSYRMWKRARRFMDYTNRECNLTFLALDLGYPDSTHFSHSIRRIYGLKPRSLLEGSRNLTIFPGENHRGAVQ
ncbi:MAG: helix-turn-helix transcriptional regulator [Pararhodobacter sp.]|nr:helix-turn-helix transcriptional regulator [Pararhodobacter sp.]